jgi:hypothetical protein
MRRSSMFQVAADVAIATTEGVVTIPGGTSGEAVTSASSGTRDRQTVEPSQASAPTEAAI